MLDIANGALGYWEDCPPIFEKSLYLHHSEGSGGGVSFFKLLLKLEKLLFCITICITPCCDVVFAVITSPHCAIYLVYLVI